ncbi:MAG: FAD-binding protein [Acutalibacter sp.]|jgi:succinate dehydrogenase/fumarate reductase flavoprotein subunit
MKLLSLHGQPLALYSFDTLVVGSGCAGFNAADTLWDLGRHSVALLTEGMDMGTSRNTGSDKQTYYKLSLCGDSADSIYQMAQDLFAGGSVNGDTALAEAAGSVRSFMKLVNLGVPFPTNQYGEYVGYRTDHDPRQRATSCGPLTSKVMTEKLEASVKAKGVPVFDGFQAVRLVVEEGHVRGLLALDRNRLSQEDWGLCLFLCSQVILATGGPAIAYSRTVYPPSQTGSTGLALEAGAAACNLQEWQYGLASVKFRWNVSGTYQQVLPRYLAQDSQGREREFLPEYLPEQEPLEYAFQKGYQWPFDTDKLSGSSLVDLCVYQETCQDNRVFLDFRQNPRGMGEVSALPPEARDYLERSGANQTTPIQRLSHMNPGAVELYRAHGIDLRQESLEVAVCAQHCNGGLAVDLNWQTTLPGLYCAGEAAGTFGVSRPGGSALNSTQVGSQRAAEHICDTCPEHTPPEELTPSGQQAAEELLGQLGQLLEGGTPLGEQRRRFQQGMSLWAGHIRSLPEMAELDRKAAGVLARFWEATAVRGPEQFPAALKNREMLLTQRAMLSAMSLTGENCGSRGSALITDPQGESLPGLPFRFRRGNGSHREDWVETRLEGAQVTSRFVEVRPLPKTDGWFENVWREYRQRKGLS